MADDGSGGAVACDVVTWHHGLIAKWWANFNLDGEEIEFFRRYVEAGQPALDLGCGSGRLLVPWISAGLDVDGVDASADMIAACAAAARRAGHQPRLFVQPVHRLNLSRRYGAIVMCGVYGIGVGPAEDIEGLRRARRHLRPGGVLALDYEIGELEEIAAMIERSPSSERSEPPDERHLGTDGFEYALRQRIVGFDRRSGRLARRIEAWQWRDGALIGHESHQLNVNLYQHEHILAALDAAGFGAVDVVGGYHGGPPTGDERFLVYVARAPA